MEVSGPPLILADCNVLCLPRRSSRSADVGQNIFFLQIMSVARLREIYFFIFNVVHAGLPASARRFSEIHTPHNLLPQQIVREEAIVYCQSINNLDC